MKKRILLCLLPLLLVSCQGGKDTSTGAISGEVSLSDFLIRAVEDNHYDISFHLHNAKEDQVAFYLSSDSHFDQADERIQVEKKKDDSLSFFYDGMANDFYLLAVSTYQEVITKENLVLPTFSLTITSGNDQNIGYDTLTFSYLPNGYTSANFFDDRGITIYRSSSGDFAEAEVVLQNATISDTFTVPNSENLPFYLFTSAFGGGKGIYISQPWEKDKTYGKDLVSIEDLKIEQENDKTMLEVRGTKKTGAELNLRLLLVSDGKTAHYTSLAIQDKTFSGSFDLSQLSDSVQPYHLYLSFLAGVYLPLPYAAIKEENKGRVEVGDFYLSFYNDHSEATLVSKEKGAINIKSASLKEKDGFPMFVTAGSFDPTLFSSLTLTGPTLTLSKPSLVFISDDKKDTEIFPLTMEDSSFSLEADLTKLTQHGSWYSLYLYFRPAQEETASADTFTSQGQYAYDVTDVFDQDDSLEISSSHLRYRFQNFENNLKLEIQNVSTTFSSWKYIRKNDRIYLEIAGMQLPGVRSYFKIGYGAGTISDIQTTDIVADEEGNFVTDIDINNIVPYHNYHVHWINGADDIELNSEYFPRPYSILSSSDGFIYSVKAEYFQNVSYYKVYKDLDCAKASDISFILGPNKPEASIKGCLNSSLYAKRESLYLQLRAMTIEENGSVTYEEKVSYAPVEVLEDFSFSSLLDMSLMEKGKKYQIKMMEKKDSGYVDLVVENKVTYCGFYTEYLPSGYNAKALTTSIGTYHIRNFDGQGNHYEIYLSLD